MESYRDKIICHLGNPVAADLLLHIVQWWSSCEVDEENLDLPMFMYCSGIMYKYYSRLGFSLIKQNKEEKYIQSEIFNNITHFIKNRLHVNFIQDVFSVQE